MSFRRVSVILIGVPMTAVGQVLPSYKPKVLPVLQSYCADCHGGKNPKGGISLTGDPASLEADQWFRVLEQIETGNMPPADEEQPSPARRDLVSRWIRGELSSMLLARQNDAGRARFRRLNRNEYANAFQDLVGVRPRIDTMLPSDGRVDGYDKVAAALPLSSDASLAYIGMAEDYLKNFLRDYPADHNRTKRAIAVESGESAGQNGVLPDGTIIHFNSDTSAGRIKYDGTGQGGYHRLAISTYGYQTDKPLAFGVYVGQPLWYPQQLRLAIVLEAPPGKAGIVETEVYINRGESLRLIPFGLGVPVPKNSLAAGIKSPGQALQWIDITEPEFPSAGDRFLSADLSAELVTEIRKNPGLVIGGNSRTTERGQFAAMFEKNYRRVAARFLRRDPTVEEMRAVLDAMNAGLDGKVPAIEILKAPILDLFLAPDFLCVIEPKGKLEDFSLAARLARFLWNSGPDDRLLELARANKLGESATLAAETDRLLADPRSGRFIADFCDLWLGLRGIDETTPDSKLHPKYEDWTKYSSVEETRTFVRNLIDRNLPITDLVNPGYSYLNKALAAHYGLPPLDHTDLRRTPLPDGSPYGGIWTHASVMKVTANGTNTSPVKRGVWISERLLGIHIPPPPPDINPIEPDIRGAKTVREQLALHRNSKSCAACHARFDGYGFALESFDVTGAFRGTYRVLTPDGAGTDGGKVDPSGTLPTGENFDDVRELRTLLARSPEALARGLTRHLVTYATGARPTALDAPAIERIFGGAAKERYSFRSLIHQLVLDDLFRCK